MKNKRKNYNERTQKRNVIRCENHYFLNAFVCFGRISHLNIFLDIWLGRVRGFTEHTYFRLRHQNSILFFCVIVLVLTLIFGAYTILISNFNHFINHTIFINWNLNTNKLKVRQIGRSFVRLYESGFIFQFCEHVGNFRLQITSTHVLPPDNIPTYIPTYLFICYIFFFNLFYFICVYHFYNKYSI